jgi:asparagine synthase (glutamine-hydrolysing)
MTSPDQRYVLVFNGELYNFRALRNEIGNAYAWQGHSDSEVVLAAYIHWGPDCLSRFHGMFAFAVWDTEQQTLFVARDRMGVKPLYYHHSAGRFVFASRPRALHALMEGNILTPDVQALRYYLECGYIPAPYAFHENIYKLPPAHYLWVAGETVQIRHYWRFAHIEPDASWEKRDEQDLLDELDGVASASVRSRMVSDVPLGAFLSGGIDSALVVALMSK